MLFYLTNIDYKGKCFKKQILSDVYKMYKNILNSFKNMSMFFSSMEGHLNVFVFNRIENLKQEIDQTDNVDLNKEQNTVQGHQCVLNSARTSRIRRRTSADPLTIMFTITLAQFILLTKIQSLLHKSQFC